MKILHFWKEIEANQRALQTTAELARALNATVFVLGCVDEEAEIPTSITEERIRRLSEDLRAAQGNLFTAAGLECRSEVIRSTGACGDKIVEFVERNRIDLLVMGIKKRSKVGKMFFGSTSQQIILEAPCKVLTVK